MLARALLAGCLVFSVGCGEGAVNGADDPDAREAMTASCTCGTAVDSQLQAVFTDMARFFDERAAARDPAQRKEVTDICDALLTGNGWDIFDLAFAEERIESPLRDEENHCGTQGVCKGSLTVANRCFFAGAVNYSLYGAAMRHCSVILRGWGMAPATTKTFGDLCGALATVNGYDKVCQAIRDQLAKVADDVSTTCSERFGTGPIDKLCEAAVDKLRHIDDLGVSFGYNNYRLPIYLWRLTKLNPLDNAHSEYAGMEQELRKLPAFLLNLLLDRVDPTKVPSFLKPAMDRSDWATVGWNTFSAPSRLTALEGLRSGMGGELLASQAASCPTQTYLDYLPWHLGYAVFDGSQ
jgi:hypothetical protein